MVLIAVRDMLFASKIDAAAKRLGIALSWAPRNEALSSVAAARKPTFLLADLGQDGVLGELKAVRTQLPATRIVGFAGHVQEDLMQEANAIGVEEVLTKGQLAARLDAVLLGAAATA